MPKVQLIFVLHVSTYRSFFPSVCFLAGACPVRRAVCELGAGTSWAAARPGESSAGRSRTYAGHTLDPAALRGAELSFAPFWRQRSACVVPCQSVFAAGALGCRKAPGALLRGSAESKRGRLGSAFCFPSVAPSLRGRCLSLTIQDKLPFGWFFVLFLCSLWSFGFHASRESEGGVCGYDLNLFACF